MSRDGFDALRTVGAACGVILGIVAALTLPAIGLSEQAASALGILIWAIAWWISGIVDEYVTALIMGALFVVACGVPTETVFGSFAGSTWWLLVAAFGLGLGMQKSGLMRRMAMAILRVFPNTYKAQVAGFMAAGTLIGPFIPSLSAKAVMLAPLSMSISDSMGYVRKGRQADGLFLAMFTGIRNVGPAVISASIIGYALLAILPEDVQSQFDMVHWLIGMLPWFVVVMALNYIAIIVLYGPKGETSTEDAAEGAPDVERISDPMFQSGKTSLSKHERAMAFIMTACVCLWVTEPLHGIASHMVAIAALVATAATGVLTREDIRKGIAWDNLIFMGIVFGLAAVFAYLGIDEWIVGICEPLMASLASNAYLFVLGIALVTIVLRFVIISEIPYLNIFMAFMIPLALRFGINPWVVGVTVYATISPWFAKYQNPIYLTAFYATDGDMVKQSDMAKYCALYLAISITGLLASVPYWQMMGLI